MKSVFLFLFLTIMSIACTSQEENAEIKWSEKIQIVLDNTKPLEYDRGERLPLYLWPAIDPGVLDEKSAEILVKELDSRGIGIVSSWKVKDRDSVLAQSLIIARAQKKLGQRINIDATNLLYGFYDGEDHTAHVDKNGKPFFDDSFGRHKMGCPFTLDERKEEIRDRVLFYLQKYKDEELDIGFIYADWEVDGPIEVNNAYETSKNCTRCRQQLGENFSFEDFRKKMREMRSYLQYFAYAEPVLSYFPKALVGNYAVYPNDGFRYWYDYFENISETYPSKKDQKAIYREWYNDFPLTGYTFAMPVVYPWWQTYTWYDFENIDYRWFYNMLLNASNAGKSTPRNIPVISFVHWHTIFSGVKPDPSIIQFSENSYQELIWHMLMRGSSTLFMWSGKNEFPKEVKLLHEVYAAAQQYGEFLDKGWPVTFDVPDKPGPVISGLALDDRVLIRRTDFTEDHSPVEIMVGTKPVVVEYAPGVCKIISLK